MENWQIVLIVFGSSGTIMIILIVVFKWMSIELCKNCFKRESNYKVDNISIRVSDVSYSIQINQVSLLSK